jgi:hypothetical protein
MTKIQLKNTLTYSIGWRILLILLWRLDYGCYWDDLPETIVIGINQRNNRMEDCRYNKDNGLPSEKESFF